MVVQLLTKKQQEFLVMLLAGNITREDNILYKSSAFYRMANQLKAFGLVGSRQVGAHYEYFTTPKGWILAMLLSSIKTKEKMP